MSNAEAKSVEPIALEFLDKKSVRSMQMFMKTFRWDHGSMLRTHQGGYRVPGSPIKGRVK